MGEKKYIDRDKILAYLSEVKEACLSDTISDIILELENGEIPASDVAPVKHGKWIDKTVWWIWGMPLSMFCLWQVHKV